MIHRSGLAQNMVIPLSIGLLRERRQYIRGLTDYRAGQIEPVVEMFIGAAHTGVHVARALRQELAHLLDEWGARCTGRPGSAAIRLLPVIAVTPVVDAAMAARALDIAAQNAQVGIDTLVRDGILTQVGHGRRNRVWCAPEALTVHDTML